MNIYEEAKKSLITLNNLAQWYESDVARDYEEAKKHREEQEKTLKKALERAKKVEELNIEQEEYIQALLFDRPYTQEKCVKRIAKIKKELEEMK